MKTPTGLPGSLGIALGLVLVLAAPAGGEWSRTNVSVDDGGPVRRCSDLRVRFGNRDAVRAEERISAPAVRGALTLRLPESSGAWVRGADRRDYAVLACKAAESAEALARVTVSMEGADLRASGPDDASWVVHFVIDAPRDGALDLEGSNGPIQVEEIAGRVKARASNGPLGFRHCTGSIEAIADNGPIAIEGSSGDVRARASNGPISISGNGGTVRADTENGPITVELLGDSWKSGNLEARAVNGPLTLSIPTGYRTATRVESAGHGPVHCRAEACGAARKTWADTDSRRIDFGDGNPEIRLSTVNGPVSVEDARKR